MAQVLNLARFPTAVANSPSSTRPDLTTRRQNPHQSWISLRHNLKCNGRFTCLFSDNRKEEQAKKALESALGEKKAEFEKWDKQIKKREEASAGGDAGGGGWFGWRGWFGGSNGDHFWQEAQQTSLAVLGIILVSFLELTKLYTWLRSRHQRIIFQFGQAKLPSVRKFINKPVAVSKIALLVSELSVN